MELKGHKMTSKTLLRTVQVITLMSLFTLSSSAIASPPDPLNIPLKSFNAVFDVHVFGFNIGDTVHKMQCKDDICNLSSQAIPSRWARGLVNEEVKETIKLDQSNNDLRLLEYKRVLTRNRDGQTTQRTFTVQRDLKNNLFHVAEKQKTFDAPPHAFDMISISYAIQYLVLNNMPLNSLFLQDRKSQEKVVFSEEFIKDEINLRFAEYIATKRFSFSNDKVIATLWLIPELNYFPGQIRVYNKEKQRAVTLKLQSKPQT